MTGPLCPLTPEVPAGTVLSTAWRRVDDGRKKRYDQGFHEITKTRPQEVAQVTDTKE